MGILSPINCKGIIEEIIDTYSVRVRIPIIHKAPNVVGSTPTDELPIACFATLPNIRLTPQIGDIVIVIFENNLYSQPIIIGYLYKSDMGESYCDIDANNINILGSAKLPDDTVVGTEFMNLIKSDVDEVKSSVDALSQSMSNDVLNITQDTSLEGKVLGVHNGTICFGTMVINSGSVVFIPDTGV